MGAGASSDASSLLVSLPDVIDEEKAKEVFGEEFDQFKFDELKNSEGVVSKETLMSLTSSTIVDTMVENGNAAADEVAVVAPRGEIVEAAAAEMRPSYVNAHDTSLDEEFRVACGKKGKSKSNASALHGLLGRGADLNAPDEDCWTGLLYASGEGLVDVLRYLLNGAAWAAGGVDVDQVDDGGCSALWVACFNKQRGAATFLMSRGANMALLGKDGEKGKPMSAAMAARRQNNPGLADLVASEARLREADPSRQAKLKSGEMSEIVFYETLKAEEANQGPVGAGTAT
mmetsp:Transcript_72174/g.145205  ORF Transcript_72174/g.145205 Transcript_72174/m.145205 type:complete len:287 (+) Transcript_72174:106-966(+)